MSADATAVAARQLTLPEELILMLLNEENGYFHQVPGRDLNFAGVGAVLAELSLLVRIDMDMESLFLTEIASGPRQHSAQYWIERLANRAESIIDLTLARVWPGSGSSSITTVNSGRSSSPSGKPTGSARPGRHCGAVHQDAHRKGHLHR
ncbi:MAG: hypothetical protein OXT72_04655 [Gammaproteobacteria bacterium]|nr:hypothetical protein [Gammaproteobacteria bacterium]MDE0247642.1 hypothetical protein [Gammaproteobacteria bacterium]